MTSWARFRISDFGFRIGGWWLLCALLALSSVVFAADWTQDERLIASVNVPQKAWALKDLCAEIGKQTSSEFYVDRREGDRKIAWFAGDMKLKTAMEVTETATGLKWRMVGDMFFLCRDPQGTALTRWNERYAEAKKTQIAGIQRKRVKDWVYNSMPFLAKYDMPWMITPLQREQLAYHRSLLYFTMTPPQLMWLNTALMNLGYEPDEGQVALDKAVAVSMDAPVQFNAAMILHAQDKDYLIEMLLSAEEAEPDQPKADESASAKAVEPQSEPQDSDAVPDKKLALTDVMKALWLTDDDFSGLAKLVTKAKAKGFNALFVPVMRSGYTIYPSKALPRERRFKDTDGLSSVVKTAAAAGMKVHAVLDATLWGDADHPVPPTASFVALHERNLLGRTFADQDKWQQAELKAMQPDDSAVQSTVSEEKRVYLCPASSRLPRLLASVAEEIAANYDVAGVCLDNVDYPKPTPFTVAGEDLAPRYGYTLEVRRGMIRLNQVDPIDVDAGSVRNKEDAEAFALWDAFRRGHLTGLLTEVSTVFKAKKSDGIFSTTLNLASDSQSPVHWSKISGLDAVLPLSEIRGTTGSQTFTVAKEDSDAVIGLYRTVVKNAVVIPAVVGLSADSVADQMSAASDVIKAAQDGGLKGFILRGDAKTLSAALDMLAD